MMLLNAFTKVIYTALRDRYGLHYLSAGAAYAAAAAVIDSYSVKKMKKAEISSDSDEYEQSYSS